MPKVGGKKVRSLTLILNLNTFYVKMFRLQNNYLQNYNKKTKFDLKKSCFFFVFPSFLAIL